MNRVVSVLEKVWAGFVSEKILLHALFLHELGARSTGIAVGLGRAGQKMVSIRFRNNLLDVRNVDGGTEA